jgi:hypothetical protein
MFIPLVPRIVSSVCRQSVKFMTFEECEIGFQLTTRRSNSRSNTFNKVCVQPPATQRRVTTQAADGVERGNHDGQRSLLRVVLSGCRGRTRALPAPQDRSRQATKLAAVTRRSKIVAARAHLLRALIIFMKINDICIVISTRLSFVFASTTTTTTTHHHYHHHHHHPSSPPPQL